MVEATPSPPFEMAEPDLLLELLVISLDAPAQLGGDGLARRDGSRTAERNLKIGTVLVRDYQGRRHIVTVEPDGYVRLFRRLVDPRRGQPWTPDGGQVAGRFTQLPDEPALRRVSSSSKVSPPSSRIAFCPIIL
jgi:hypothetical protein